MNKQLILGSHDSAAYLGKESSILAKLFSPFCVTQNKTITEQLSYGGIRAFDIRCKIHKGEVWCYHGIARFRKLETVLRELSDFYASQPYSILLIGFGREDRGIFKKKYSDQELWDQILLTAYSVNLYLSPLTSVSESRGGCYVTGFYRMTIDFGIMYPSTGVSVGNFGRSAKGVLKAVDRLLHFQFLDCMNFIYTNSLGGVIPFPRKWANLFNTTARNFVAGRNCIWYSDFV